MKDCAPAADPTTQTQKTNSKNADPDPPQPQLHCACGPLVRAVKGVGTQWCSPGACMVRTSHLTQNGIRHIHSRGVFFKLAYPSISMVATVKLKIVRRCKTHCFATRRATCDPTRNLVVHAMTVIHIEPVKGLMHITVSDTSGVAEKLCVAVIIHLEGSQTARLIVLYFIPRLRADRPKIQLATGLLGVAP